MSILIKPITHCFAVMSAIGIFLYISAAPGLTTPMASDPGRLGVGARAMGMGNAFTALSDDASAIFTNPAGLMLFDNTQFTSMYSKVYEEFQYKQLGGTFPVGSGMAGVGFVGNSVGGIGLTDISTANNRPYLTKDATFHDDVYYFSYAENITNYLKPLKLNGDVLLGGAFKLYAKGSPEVAAYEGSGMGADLGMLYKWSPDITLGVHYKNFLPHIASMGTIKWAGSEDELPSVIKVGSAIHYNQWNLICNVDSDIDPGLKKPLLFHLGGEWQPIPYFAFRAGIDQLNNPQQTGTGVYSNYSVGCGIQFSGVRFDYAYRSFYNEDANHFFTLTYIGEPGGYKWVNKPKIQSGNGGGDLSDMPNIRILSPVKNLVTNRSKLMINGVCSTPVTLNINGKDVFFKGPTFNYTVDINKYGRTSVDVMLKYLGKDFPIYNKKIIHLQEKGTLRDEDMPRSILNAEVSYNYTAPVPGKVLIKDILALANIYNTPSNGNNPDFDAAMRVAKRNRLIPEATGHPFEPEKPASWGAALALISKVEGLNVDTSNPDPKSHWSSPYIRAAKANQIIPNYWNKSPDSPISGRELVELINRTKMGRSKIRELVDWVSDGDVAYDDGNKSQRFDRNEVLNKIETPMMYSPDRYRPRRNLDFLNNYNQAERSNNTAGGQNPVDRGRLNILFQNQFHTPLIKSLDAGLRPTPATRTLAAPPENPGNTREFFAEQQPEAPKTLPENTIKAPNIYGTPLDKLSTQGENNTRFSQENNQTKIPDRQARPTLPEPPLPPTEPPTEAGSTAALPQTEPPAELTEPTPAEAVPSASVPGIVTLNTTPLVIKPIENYLVNEFPPLNSIIVEIGIDKAQVAKNAMALEEHKYAPKVYPLIVNDTMLYELYLGQLEDETRTRDLIKELRKLGFAAYKNESK